MSVTGPYGVGFLIGWFATVANWVWSNPGSRRRRRRVVAPWALALVAALVGGSSRLALFPPGAERVHVAGVVPSEAVVEAAEATLGGELPRTKKELATLDPAEVRQAFGLVNDELLANTRRAARAGAEIIAWSESAALLASAEDAPALLTEAAAVAEDEGIYLLVADLVPEVADETHLIGPDGEVLWEFQKLRPIPVADERRPDDLRPGRRRLRLGLRGRERAGTSEGAPRTECHRGGTSDGATMSRTAVLGLV